MNIVIADPDTGGSHSPKRSFTIRPCSITALGVHGPLRFAPKDSRSRASRSTGGTLLSFVMRVKLSPPGRCCRCSWATATRTSLLAAVCSSRQTIGSHERMRQIAGAKSFGRPSRKRRTLNIFVQTLSVGERAVRYWKEGLRQHPNHAPTKEVIRTLQSNDALQALLQRVQEARTRLTRGIDGGHPVCIAVRVDPGWFSARWRFHLDQWEIGMKEVNMRCEVQTIAPECILASVDTRMELTRTSCRRERSGMRSKNC